MAAVKRTAATRSIDELRRDLVWDTTVRGHTLELRTTWGLFSPRELDAGSRLLLEHVPVEPGDDVLDLGCGYGPLGLWIAKLAPDGSALLVDKDFVAVEYARLNAAANDISHVEAQLSNGFGEIGDRQFDLIVSNLPAKAGNELYTLWFHDARARLRPGGRLVVVTISGPRKFIRRAFEEEFGGYEKLKQGRTHTVSLARVAP